MTKAGLKKAVWRSRAIAIIGLLIILLAIFQGLPSALKGTLFVVFGFLELCFGFAGSRHKAYSDPEPNKVIEEQAIEPVLNKLPEAEPVTIVPEESVEA